MPTLEFLSSSHDSLDAEAAASRLERMLASFAKKDRRCKDPTWTSPDGKSRVAFRHVDLATMHLPEELAPFILLDGVILACGPEAMGPEAMREVIHILCPTPWVRTYA